MRKIVSVLAGVAVAACVAVGSKAASAQEARYNWSGLYLGGSAGYANKNLRGDFVTSPTLNHLNVEGGSGTVGLTVGIQHQYGQIVLGFEGNISAPSGTARRTVGADCVAVLSFPIECHGKIGSLITIGPRVGYAVSPQAMLFVTGGYATGRVTSEVYNASVRIGEAQRTHSGGFFGGGVDYALTPNWTIGAEYQHVHLNTGRHFDNYFGGCCTVTAETRDMKADIDIVRVRAGYKFNWGN